MSGVRHIAFPDRSPILRDAAEVSRFSCMLFLDVLGSLTTPGPAFARDFRCRRCCLPATAKGSAPESKVFEAQSASPSMPLSTLRQPPRDGVHARLEARMESLLLSCKALSSSTTCRFIPAHGCPGPSPVPPNVITYLCTEQRLSQCLALSRKCPQNTV